MFLWREMLKRVCSASHSVFLIIVIIQLMKPCLQKNPQIEFFHIPSYKTGWLVFLSLAWCMCVCVHFNKLIWILFWLLYVCELLLLSVTSAFLGLVRFNTRQQTKFSGIIMKLWSLELNTKSVPSSKTLAARLLEKKQLIRRWKAPLGCESINSFCSFRPAAAEAVG